MLKGINDIIEKHGLSYNHTLNYVRSRIMLKDIEDISNNAVEDITSEYSKNRIQTLERTLEGKEEEIEQLRF